MTEELHRVDLRDPGTLRSVLNGYLRLKVCPVEADRRPPLLFPTTVEIQLPDGSSMTRWGTVIRYTGPKGFLVQFDGPLDLTTLDELATRTEAAQLDDAMFVPSADFEPETDFDPERTSQSTGRQSQPEPELALEPDPSRGASDPDPEPYSVSENVEDSSNLDAWTELSEPAREPVAGPIVDAFVTGPDPDVPPEPPDAPSSFMNDRTTTVHETDDDGFLEDAVEDALEEASSDILEEADVENTSEGLDPFADLLDGLEGASEPGPPGEDHADEGIPDGWTSTGEVTIPADGETLAVEAGGDAAPTSGAAEAPSAQPEARGNRRASRLNSTEMSAIYKQIETMSPSEKQRLARSGNRITRGLLAKDRNKNVHQFVFRNPKIAVEEVIEYAKLAGLSKDAIRIIASTRSWVASRQVVLGLVRNPGTPVDLLPGLVQRLGPSQWQVLSKSADVRPQVSSLAKKLLLASRR